MSEQILKELGIELKKLELKEDDILIVETDLSKIRPQLAEKFIQAIENRINNKVIPYPKGMNVKNIGVESIIKN